jgi:chemotaxis protein CheX
MMMGMEVGEVDEMSQSALSELTNMLTANAATNFYNLGINIDISTPALFYGDNITAKMSSNQVICIELFADENPIEINIAFQK